MLAENNEADLREFCSALHPARTADFMELQEELKSRFVGAMYYPAFLAVVGFVLLVGLASWWMVRRSDPDAEPMPPVPPSTPPPSDLI